MCVFRAVDCVMLYVPDLAQGIAYYRDGLGLPLIWKDEHAVGFGLAEGSGELVLQDERPGLEVDMLVDSAAQAVRRIEEAGGTVVSGPFDIAIGRCAVVCDPFGNRLTVLDMSKGPLTTDGEGNVTGLDAGRVT